MPQFSGVGVLTADRQLIVRTWNGWLADATGISEDRAIGRPLSELAGGPTSEWYRDIFADVVGTGTPRVLAPAFHRFLIPCAPSEPSTIFDRMQQRVTVAPLRAGDQIVGLIVTIEDVTARLEAERRLSRQLEEGDSNAAALAAVGADDWRVRRDAVRALHHAATPADIQHLIQSLQRDHHDLSVLNSALQVLVAADLDVVEPLAELLDHHEPNVRMQAALALGELRGDAAVPGLLAALDDEDGNVRFHAIEALGRIGSPEAVDPLAAIAASGDFFLAFAAVDALSRIDDARVTGSLVCLLDRDEIRPAIVDALAALGDEDAVPSLVDQLNTGASDAAPVAAALERIERRYEDTYQAGAHVAALVRTRLTAAGIAALEASLRQRIPPLKPLVRVLGWSGPAAVSALAEALDDPDVQASVTEALVHCGSAAVEPLLGTLGSGTRQERMAAVAVLGRLGDRRAVGPLLALLRSADADLVVAVGGALAALGDERALDDLLPLFAHELASVRQAAVAAINAIAAPRTASSVHARLADPDPRVRECAIRVAGYFGFDDCVAGVVNAIEDSHEEVRRAVIEQLPLLDHPQSIPFLIQALAKDTPRNRAAAAHALRLVEDPSAIWPIERALDDQDAWVRYFAADTIARRRVIEAVPALVRVSTSDPATHVRIAALHALGALDVPDVVDVAASQIQSPDPDLVAAAISSLSGTSDPRVDRLLEEAIRSPNVASRVPAAHVLSSRPDRAAAETLAWAARLDEPADLRPVAIEGLARIANAAPEGSDEFDGGQAAVGALLELAAERDAREEALAALATLTPARIPAIAAGLTSVRQGVRLAAVEALGRLRHAAASGALARALESDDAAVRGVAIGVFGRLGTTSIRDDIVRMRSSDPDPGVRLRAAALCRRHGWDGK